MLTVYCEPQHSGCLFNETKTRIDVKLVLSTEWEMIVRREETGPNRVHDRLARTLAHPIRLVIAGTRSISFPCSGSEALKSLSVGRLVCAETFQ